MRFLALVALAACWTKPGPAPVDDHLDDPVHLVAGNKHACSIDPAGQLACWGDNAHGQLGVSGVPASGAPLLVSGNWSWIAAGDHHTCGIADGAVFCWGDDLPKAQVVLPGNARPAKLFAGGSATCAIDDSGRAYCWGFAPPFVDHFAEPTEVQPHHRPGPWRSFALTADHACAIDDADASMYCWGANDVEQIDTTGTTYALADAPAAAEPVVAVAVGPGATCAVTLDRGLVCGGDVSTGMVGTAPANTPSYTIDTTQRWTAIALGHRHVCGIANGGVECFGADDRGALGDGTFEPRLALPSASIAQATAVVAGDSFSCAIDEAGVVSCWGSNAYGELGNGEIASRFAPTRVPIPVLTGLMLEHVDTGDGHTCVTGQVGGSHHVYCFGNNASGQVSPTTTATVVTTPTEVPGPPGFPLYKVTTGGHHTCAVVRDFGGDTTLYCWGANDHGQLGSPDPSVHEMMIDVKTVDPSQAYWLEVAAGATATCAIDDGFTMLCWGLLPGIGDRQPPTQASASAAHVAVGTTAVLAVDYTSPQVVRGYGIDPAAPCTVGASYPSGAQLVGNMYSGLNEFAIAQGRAHGCTIETGGTNPGVLTCWGDNANGQTGSPPGPCMPPTRVFASQDWDDRILNQHAVAAAGDHSCAIDATEHVWCWGRNEHGELAALPDSSGTAHDISATMAAIEVTTGPWHSCVVDGGLNVDCWGENRFGELGIGSSFHATPAPIIAP